VNFNNCNDIDDEGHTSEESSSVIQDTKNAAIYELFLMARNNVSRHTARIRC
jgi:hypothetical protein